ncbi:MAG: c-type cytochrome [Geminicoccaceae bacterium]
MSFGTGCKALALALNLCLGANAIAQDLGAGQSRLGGAAAVLDQEPERLPDPAHGEKLFRECRKCHAVQPGEVKIGPSLAGVVGRRPGSVPAFGYSLDMINFGNSGATWDEESLDRFLTRPRALIAGTKMVFQGFRKPSDRADLIAYLSTIVADGDT